MAQFNTFKKRLAEAYKALRLATPQTAVHVNSGLYNSVTIAVFNQDCEIIASADLADYLSETEMQRNFKNVMGVLQSRTTKQQ